MKSLTNNTFLPLASMVQNRHHAGCMVCGHQLTYLQQGREICCHYCDEQHESNALCINGHYICDNCHQQDGLLVIRSICLASRERDMITLFKKIRLHPAIPMHGPEHHAMVPGIILAVYRNQTDKIGKEEILAGIERGSKVPGGACGFMGSCGAAVGVAIAFSIILKATPLTPHERSQVISVTARVLSRIAEVQGARCCQRETVTALLEAANLSEDMLAVVLLAADDFSCSQYKINRECVRKQCFLYQGIRESGNQGTGDRGQKYE